MQPSSPHPLTHAYCNPVRTPTRAVFACAAIGQGGGVGGTLSSFAFTPVQGIELVNPDAKRMRAGGVSTSILGSSGSGYGYGGSGGAGSGVGTSVSAVLNLGTAAAQASYFDHSGTFTMVRGPGR